MVRQDMRKGTWTEQEDIKLVSFVGLFGDRRWDFIAKVSGLHRTGKSCRLRWVNYLHPGLKRGKMTSQEERLVLELHSKWGNRWSKIARKLPGRTDNEIKNYWRTHMRKMAQENKRAAAASSSSSASSNNSSSGDQEESFYDKGGPNNMMICSSREIEITGEDQACEEEEGYSMDDIWKDIEVSEENISEEYNFSCPSWEYSSSESLWVMDEGESQIFNPFFPQGAPLL